MNAQRQQPTMEGPAARVIVMGPQAATVYENVYVQLDSTHALTHIFTADGQAHVLSAPIQSCILEWQDTAALSPLPYTPSYAPGAFERMGEQMNGMLEQMQRGFGPR